MNTVTWQDYVQAMTEEDMRNVAQNRGYSPAFVKWLHGQGCIGMVGGMVAFPIHNRIDEVVGAHIRTQKSWRVEWLTNEQKYQEQAALVIGDLKTGRQVWVFESQWDAFAVMDKLGWHKPGKGFGSGLAVVITRGAGNGRFLIRLCPPETVIFAFQQNDPPLQDGKTSAADKWLKAVIELSGCEVRLVSTPKEHEDPNDWTKAGATITDLLKAVHKATTVAERPPAVKIKTSGERTGETMAVPSPDETAVPEQDPGDLDPGPFPADALNPVMRRIAEEFAAVHCLELQLLGVTTVATVAGALGRGWQLTGAINGILPHGNLFVLAAAPRSYGKRAASELAQPILDASLELERRFNETERPLLTVELMEIQKKLRRWSTARGQESDREEEAGAPSGGQLLSREDLAKLVRRKEEIEQLVGFPPSFHVGSSSAAALAERLARNNSTLFSFSPEAGELVRIAMGRFNKDKKGDFDLLLSGYSVENFSESRVGRGSHDLAPCLSTLWFCQPLIVKEILANEEALERGLAARMLGCIIEPTLIPEDDGVERFVSPEAKAAWEKLVAEILHIRAGQTEPQIIQCSPEAREVFRAFYNESVRLRNGRFRDIQGDLGRWRENAIRVAIGQWVADRLTLSEVPDVVTAEQAERSVKLARWCHLSMLTFIEKGRATRLFQQAQELVDLLAVEPEDEMTLRNLETRHGKPRALVTSLATDFPDLLRVVTKRPKTGRPSEVLKLVNG